MTSIVQNITKDIIKAGLALSFSALAYSNIKKVVTSNSLKLKIRQFISNQSAQYKQKYVMAKNIILVSSQECELDQDMSILSKVPNQEISLTEQGLDRSAQIGAQIQKLLEESAQKNKKSIKICAYSSPYARAKQTLDQMKKNMKNDFISFTDLNLRDQDLGNLPKDISSSEVMAERELISPFFYRFQDGESEADVYLRVSTFTNTIIRELSNFDRNMNYNTQEKFVVVVAHPIIVSQLEQTLKNFNQDLSIQTFTQ